MAIYSNFDGTMRDGITIGKKGPSVKRDGTAGLSVTKSDGTAGTVIIAPGTSATHAVNKSQLDGIFGTGSDQVRKNSELETRYEKTSNKNVNGGYVGLGADGKIEFKYIPPIPLNSVIVKNNKYARNIVTGLKAGDSCIITPTLMFNPTMVYEANDVVRLLEGGVMKFYAATQKTTVPQFNGLLWNNTTIVAGNSYNVGDKVLFNNKLFIVTASYTAPNPVVDPATVIASFSPYSDSTYMEWSGGVAYSAGSIVKRTVNGVGSFYSAKANIPAMDPVQWTGTTLKSSTTYAIGDEVLYNNKNFMLKAAYTSPATIVDPADNKLVATFAQDVGPDSGYFILTVTPAANAATTDDQWQAVNSGTTVDSFNGRVGPVSSQSGDYNSSQIVMTPYSDMFGSTVQANMQTLADSRVKKSGDRMSGNLILARGIESAPALTIPSSNKSGLYDDSGSIAFAIEGEQKLAITATGVVFGTSLDMNGKSIIRLADPQSASDATNKKYVDSKPLVLSGTVAPTNDTGRDGDVYLTVLGQGSIAMPSTDTWTDLSTDGITALVINGNAVPSAAVTLNRGLTWTQSLMPAASSSSSDQFVSIASNNSDSFVAIRRMIDMTKSTGKIAYTVDRGRTWNQASTFGGSGAYIHAAVYPDSTAYMLFPVAKSNVAYSSTTGDVWNALDKALPVEASWAAAAGARGCYVALVLDSAAGSNVAVYQDFGNDWRQATMASTLVWKSVSTSDGVNYVAVGEAPGASKDTNIVNYSNNRGATWFSATLPSSGRWSAVSTNGTTFVAIRQNSNKAAYSTDYGKTWSEITLPAVRGWTRLVANPRMYMALSTDTTSNSAVAVSVDGGRTWSSDIAGQIVDISFKNSGKWLAYAGSSGSGPSSPATSTLYVRRDGDKMTGSLVIAQDAAKESIIANGAITAPTFKASKYASYDLTPKTAGSHFIGTTNADAVDIGNTYGYTQITSGSSAGFSLTTKAVVRSSTGIPTEIDVVTLTKDTLNVNGSVGIGGTGVVYSNAALAMDISTKKHGIVLFNSDVKSNTNTEMLSLGSNVKTISKYAIKLHANMTAVPNKDAASPLSTGEYVFGVTTNGVMDVSEAICLGTGRGTDQPTAKLGVKMSKTYACGLELTGDMPTDAALRITSPSPAGMSATYKHIDVKEGTTSVLSLDKANLVVNKLVTINNPTAKSISLYIGGGDAFRMPVGRNSNRPTEPDIGMMRCNAETSKYEVYMDDKWQDIQTGVRYYSGTQAANNWTKLAAPTAEGHTYKFTIPKATSGAFGWPFVQFQALAKEDTKYRGTTFDYEVADNYDIVVYARYLDGDYFDAVRYYISW